MGHRRWSWPRGLAALVWLLSLAGCGDLADPVVVRFGNETLTEDDLRRAYAELPAPTRPLLGTREQRREFVEFLVRRLLLSELGRDVLESDPELRDRVDPENALRQRLQVLVSAAEPVTVEEIEEARVRMRAMHRIERIRFASREDALRILAQESSDWEALATGARGASDPEWVAWSPFPNPMADVADTSALLAISQPFRVGTHTQVLRVIDRSERELPEEEARDDHIKRGLRARKQAAMREAFAEGLRRDAAIEYDEETIAMLVDRTRGPILAGAATEHDPPWALPAITEAEGSLVVASWKTGTWTAGQYCADLRGMLPSQRPKDAPLATEVRARIEVQVLERLYAEEAARRGLARDWWVRRRVRDLEQERRIDVALASLRDSIRVEPAQVDSLATALLTLQPNLFRRSARARLLRFDFATRAEADLARREIDAAGDALKYLEDLLDGEAPPRGTYHVTYLSPGGVGVAEIERAVFEDLESPLSGPYELAGTWVLIHRLELQPSAPFSETEVVADVAERIRRSRIGDAVSDWLVSRRESLGLSIDEDQLDTLGPGA